MRAKALAAGLIGLITVVGCGGGGVGGSTPGVSDPAVVPPAPVGLASVAVFYSGHSLLDDPVGDHTASVATSVGKAIQWNQQIYVGSPVRVRTRGLDAQDPNWSGYRTGKNRNGQNLDVVSELRNPSTISGRYDALVLAENHNLALMLQGEDTVRYARHIHERLIEGNPQGTTYLYHAWKGVRDVDNPSDWIAFEKSAATTWRCVAGRINQSLAAESRSDRLRYMPTGLALAILVERAMQGRIEGLDGSARQIVGSLMTDDVHVTDLGAYFVSLMNFASLYGTSPAGAWAPSGVADGTKRALESLAWEVTSGYQGAVSVDLGSCRGHMQSHCTAYWNYVGEPQNTASCQAHFSAASTENPFYYDSAQDAGYWFQAP